MQKLEAFGPWNNSDLEILTSFGSRRRRLTPHQAILREHDSSEDAYLVQSGWMCMYKLLPDGGRQVLNFPIPGDIVGVHDVDSIDSPFTFESLTDADISPIPLSLLEGAKSSVNVARALRWSAARDAAIMAEHLVNVGRRSALVRTAHLILETALRLRHIGVDVSHEFDCPVNQSWMADALGLTAIHLNRVLRELREAELVTVRTGHITIHDFDGLKELAVFEPEYLAPPKRSS